MKSDEARIAEAVAALRTRLDQWGIDEPHDKAHTYVTDMLRNGWRPNRALPALAPERSAAGCPPPDEYKAARQALRPARTRNAETPETEHEETSDE